MASKQFIKVLFIRFLAYLFVFTGIFGVLFQFGPLMVSELSYRKDKLLGIKHTLPPEIITSQTLNNPQYANPPPETSRGSSGFGSLIGLTPQVIKPVSTEFGIVIEKINANAVVIPQVDPGNEAEYTAALTRGVAEAKGSTLPGEPGNLYIFSHSADAPWNIIRFNAIFYLLRELEPGDRIIVYYLGKRYDYLVFDKNITSPDDISFLTNRYDKPVLTLQTCDPPGTLRNRLVVRARLAGS